MTKIFNFVLKIKGGGREGGTCEVLRPCHPPKIWNVHKGVEKNVSGDPAHKHLYIGVGVNTPGSTRKGRIAFVRVKQLTLPPRIRVSASCSIH